MSKTIAAIATPLGEGGIAIIRISGKEAVSIADKIFTGNVNSYESHTAHFGYVVDTFKNKVDTALVLVMRGSRSYTGEDTVEIQCHGGVFIARRVLELALEAGATLAGPGEFTFKAFINGKMDLTQAEAVQQMIHANNEKALQLAKKHLDGALSEKIHAFKQAIIEIAADIEVWVDFPEEAPSTFGENIFSSLHSVVEQMQQLLDTFHEGRKIQEGIRLGIVGPPNVGKSSLMNALLEKKRAIVTAIAGTTRDLIEESITLNGYPVHLIDTAGIRFTNQIIEKEGIKRSWEIVKEADLLLYVLDISQEKLEVFSAIPKEKTILVWNKCDLPHKPPQPREDLPMVALSAKEGRGLDLLKEMIDKLVWKRGGPKENALIITKTRHREALSHAIAHCQQVVVGLKENLFPELLMIELREALQELGKIIGTDVTEEILSSIFSRFCIGK